MSIICDICQEEYQNSINSEKTPRILGCGDTFCTHCLRELRKDNKIKCPICQAEFTDEVDTICINKYVINLVENKILSAVKYLDDKDKDIQLDKFDFKFSIALIGESGGGKTCIGNFYRMGKPSEFYPTSTISLENSFKFLSIHHKKVKIRLWDTAGQERYRSLSIGYLRGVHAILLVFPLTNLISFEDEEKFKNKNEEEKLKIEDDYRTKVFEDLEYWITQCKQINVQKNQIIYLVGNKVDIQEEFRLIKEDDTKSFTKKYNLRYYETSAITGTNIKKMFDDLAYELMGIYGDINEDGNTTNSKLSKKIIKKKKKCC